MDQENAISMDFNELNTAASDIYKIIGELSKLVSLSEQMKSSANEGLECKAKIEVTSYYESFNTNSYLLVNLYTKAWQYLLFVAKEMKYTDDQIAKIVANSLKEGGVLGG